MHAVMPPCRRVLVAVDGTRGQRALDCAATDESRTLELHV
jgi:hypothetical protein